MALLQYKSELYQDKSGLYIKLLFDLQFGKEKNKKKKKKVLLSITLFRSLRTLLTHVIDQFAKINKQVTTLSTIQIIDYHCPLSQWLRNDTVIESCSQNAIVTNQINYSTHYWKKGRNKE